jgi:hypothetical protein
VIVDVRFFGVIALLVLPTVVVAVGQRSVIVDVGVPGGSMLEVITEIPTVVVADMPMVVPMLGRRMSMLGFLPLAFGALPHGGHYGASFRVKGCLENPA